MSVAIVTGSAGLVGSDSVRFLSAQGLDVIGIDNDMRAYFFGEDASTTWNRKSLEQEVRGYRHESIDIRDKAAILKLFAAHGKDISTIIHTAAQPSHDWAAKDPGLDFAVNAVGTVNLLEATRTHCPEAAFVFVSTNKVYGDQPNVLPLVENDTRWELDGAIGAQLIDESMSIDGCFISYLGLQRSPQMSWFRSLAVTLE